MIYKKEKIELTYLSELSKFEFRESCHNWVRNLICNEITVQVMAGLLNIADRADWRNCTLTKQEELKMAEGFKDRFQQFDPNR